MAETDRPWRRALVTGASSGIGQAFAQRLAADGVALVVVARSADRLGQLAAGLDVEAEVVVADLETEAGQRAVERRLAATAEPVDLLVNCAGFGVSGSFVATPIDSQIAMIEVNVVAVVRLTHAAVSAMGLRGHGGVLNVSSVAGYIPAPNSAVYAATKAFVTAFSQSIHEEVRRSGVIVTALCPGFTRTEFQSRAGSDVDASRMPSALWQSPDEVAQAGLRAMRRGRALVVSGAQNRAMVGTVKLLPASVARRVAGMFTAGSK
jgi:short-subunit dehydrogenase